MAEQNLIVPSNVKKPKSHLSKPIKTPLSTEFVQDSDESGVELNNRPQKEGSAPTKSKGRTPARLTKPERIPKIDEDASKIRKTSDANPGRSLDRDIAARENHSRSSTESASTSNSASRSSTPTPVKQVLKPGRPAQSNALKAADDANALRKSKSLDPDISKTELKAERNGDTSEDGASESDDSDSEGSTESESGSNEGSSPRNRRTQNSEHEDQAIQPSAPFEPPPEFKSAIVSLHPSSKISEIFTASNLTGKQIWHITAPVSVPIESVKEVSPQNLQNGAPVLSHKGSEYGLALDSNIEHANNHALLVPHTQKNEYRISTVPITKTFHLQQRVELPNRAHEPPSPLISRPLTHVKAPRQQPQGLKMRYRPFGASEDSEPDEDAMPAQIPRFRKPEVKDNALTQKRKQSSLENGQPSPIAKHAKKQKSRAKDTDVQEIEQSALTAREQRISISPSKTPQSNIKGNAANGHIAREEKKRKRDVRHSSPGITLTTPRSLLPTDVTKEAETIVPEEVVDIDAGVNRVSSEKDSKEDKAKRKEARRKRKEIGSKGAESKLLTENGGLVHPQLSGQLAVDSASLQTPSPRKSIVEPKSQKKLEVSSQSTSHKETKEDRAKRKKEKRKLKFAPNPR